MALCHHEVLHLALASTQGTADSSVRDVSIIYENRHELQDAASGVTECLKELIQLRLARWLPISAVACTALPLVLHILDVKLSPPRPGTTSTDGQNSQSALKQHRLNVLIEAMKTYQPQYDGVDWVSETIRHIVNLAQLDGVQPNATTDSGNPSNNNNNNNNDNNNDPPSENGNDKIQDWTDILTSHPSLYLRLALTMDLSLSKDRLPEEGDFPASLRGLLSGTPSTNPLRALLAANKQQQQQAQQQQHLRPVPGSMSSIPPQLQRPKPAQPRSVAPQHTMKAWLDADRAASSNNNSSNYGMQNGGGMDMDLDESPQPGGLPASVRGYSESDSGSQDSYEDSPDEHDHHNHLHNHAQHQPQQQQQQQQQQQFRSPNAEEQHQQQHQQQQDCNLFQPFTTEEMEVLEAHVLDAFTLHNESPPSSEGAFESAIEIFGEVVGADAVGEWLEQGRKGDGGEREDGETARVLMDALRETEVGA